MWLPDECGVRAIVCGGREYSDAEFFNSTMDALHAKHHFRFIIEGGAFGADKLAKDWAVKNHVPGLEFRANWKLYGKRAGPLRNQRMLDKGKPDMVIAFPGGRGTADMVSRAKQAGVRIVQP